MSFHNTTTHKARKAHRCAGSCGVIQPGETYTRFTGVSDGDFYSVAMKVPIAEIYQRLNEECWKQEGEGMYFDEMMEAVADRFTEHPLDEQAIADMRAMIAANPASWLQSRFDKITAAQVGRVIIEAMQ